MVGSKDGVPFGRERAPNTNEISPQPRVELSDETVAGPVQPATVEYPNLRDDQPATSPNLEWNRTQDGYDTTDYYGNQKLNEMEATLDPRRADKGISSEIPSHEDASQIPAHVEGRNGRGSHPGEAGYEYGPQERRHPQTVIPMPAFPEGAFGSNL